MRKDVSKEIESDATPPGVLFVLKELIFAKIGKIIKSVQKMFDLEVFLY